MLFVTSHPGQLILAIPLWVFAASQRAVTVGSSAFFVKQYFPVRIF